MGRKKHTGFGAIILIAALLIFGSLFAVPIFTSIDESVNMTGDQYEQEYDGSVAMTQFATQSLLPVVAVIFGIGAVIFATRKLW